MIGLRDLCTPAFVYLILSFVAIVFIAFQNLGGEGGMYCVGSYGCKTSFTFIIFIFKIIYILFWTWLLNIICKSGYETVSWILVLLPFILMFIFIALVFTTHFPADKYMHVDIMK
jgi:hypothetical protein